MFRISESRSVYSKIGKGEGDLQWGLTVPTKPSAAKFVPQGDEPRFSPEKPGPN